MPTSYIPGTFFAQILLASFNPGLFPGALSAPAVALKQQKLTPKFFFAKCSLSSGLQ